MFAAAAEAVKFELTRPTGTISSRVATVQSPRYDHIHLRRYLYWPHRTPNRPLIHASDQIQAWKCITDDQWPIRGSSKEAIDFLIQFNLIITY